MLDPTVFPFLSSLRDNKTVEWFKENKDTIRKENML